jgi:hypothetical protein
MSVALCVRLVDVWQGQRTYSGGLVAVQGNGDVAVVGVVAGAAGVRLTAWGGGAEWVVVAAGVLLSVVCEGVVAADDDDESLLSCLKIFLSLSIVLG